VSAILNALLGLIAGFFISAGALFMSAIASRMSESPESGLFAALFGVGAIIFMPIIYGIMGFIMGLITAWLYNLVAGWVGGIEMEFEQAAGSQSTQAM
jgi:hypothetical protein